MKTALIAVAALVAALAFPVVASAQDWVMDWHSTGNVAGAPFTWDITGTSPASLTPVSGGLAPTFATQAFDLSFTHMDRIFGGRVAQGSFQTPDFAVPAPPPINSFPSTSFSSGTFNLTGNSFTLDVLIGLGNNRAELTATGMQNVPTTPITPTTPVTPIIPVTPTTPTTPTASAAEPAVLLLGGTGLIAAAAMRRRHCL